MNYDIAELNANEVAQVAGGADGYCGTAPHALVRPLPDPIPNPWLVLKPQPDPWMQATAFHGP